MPPSHAQTDNTQRYQEVVAKIDGRLGAAYALDRCGRGEESGWGRGGEAGGEGGPHAQGCRQSSSRRHVTSHAVVDAAMLLLPMALVRR